MTMGGLTLTVVNHGPALSRLDDERPGVAVARPGCERHSATVPLTNIVRAWPSGSTKSQLSTTTLNWSATTSHNGRRLGGSLFRPRPGRG